MEEKEIIASIIDGKIFVYPTDTIYGLGCNALLEDPVEKIRKLKGRDKKSFSVIAPGFEWIEENCVVDIDLKKYLPGPYTIILKKKEKDFLMHVSDSDSIGIRIPDCDFTNLIFKAGIPFITTSVNLHGERPISNISDIPDSIKKGVDVFVDSGPLEGRPSTLIIDGKEIKR